MSAPYLFVYDTRDGSFPERYRILRAGETDPGDEPLTGAIRAGKRDAALKRLRARYAEPHFEVDIEYATRWETIVRTQRGTRRRDRA